MSYTGKPLIVINDVDFFVVARNIVMLLLALSIPDQQEAAEAIMHCWYSALLRPADFRHIEELHPRIKAVYEKIKTQAAGSLHSELFTFEPCSLRVSLKKEHWQWLLVLVSRPRGLTVQMANRIRHQVTLAPHRIDYLHRFLLLQQPKHRICHQRFRQDGILLPFGYSRDDFTVPNP